MEHLDRREHHALLPDETVCRPGDPGTQLGIAIGKQDDRRHAEGAGIARGVVRLAEVPERLLQAEP